MIILQVTDALFGAEPWTVPWTAKTIVQVKHSVYITLMLCGIHLFALSFLVTIYHINLFANCNFIEANPLNYLCIDLSFLHDHK